MKRDIPAVTICSTVFEGLGRAQARGLNYPDLPIVTVPHPFGSLTRAEIRALAESCLADILTILAAPGDGAVGRHDRARTGPP